MASKWENPKGFMLSANGFDIALLPDFASAESFAAKTTFTSGITLRSIGSVLPAGAWTLSAQLHQWVLLD